MALKQKGEASNMKKFGSDESYGTHGNNPQRAAWDDGHALNESYKVPTPHPQGRPNYSYMHPLVNDKKGWSPAMPGRDKGVEGEKELRTKAPKGMSGKVVFPPQQGKSKV